MNERTSKQLLVMEMLILILPTTVFFGFFGPMMFWWGLYDWTEVQKMLSALALLFCGIAIIVIWFSSISFLRKGRLGLHHFSTGWKMIGYFGGVYVVCSWIFLYLFEIGWVTTENVYTEIPLYGLFGTPLLIPLLHLSLEWHATSKDSEL